MDNSTRNQLKRLRKSLRERPAPKKSAVAPLPADELDLFREAMRGVTPLPSAHYTHPPRHPAPWPRQQAQTVSRESMANVSDFWPWDELASGEELLHTRPGISLDTLRKLRRGEWRVQAELDLHGHSSDSARARVAVFLHECQQRHLRCVRIIHGKGLSSHNREPVLKLKLKNWLAQRHDVLAFCQARPAEGGSGAAVILLRARRET